MKKLIFAAAFAFAVSGLAQAAQFDLSGIAQLSAGGSHACVVAGGAAKCWGSNSNGQLGGGAVGSSRALASDVVGLTSNVVAVAAGGAHSCAIVLGGGVKCWGQNTYGQLGDGSAADRAEPTDVQGLPFAAAAIAAGSNHTCALSSSGATACWGRNAFGQLGNGNTVDQPGPVTVSGLTAVAISAALNHTCALTSSGGAMCWGSNGAGELGDGTLGGVRSTPVAVSGLSGVTSIATAGDPGAGVEAPRAYTCATMAGAVKCWGSGFSSTPADVSGIGSTTSAVTLGATRIFGAAGASTPVMHACVITSSGGVKCWGSNWCGIVGDGTTPACGMAFPTVAPAVDVAGLTSGVSSVSAGSTFTCALIGGRVRCWGAGYGSTPVAIMQGTIPQSILFSMTPPPGVGGTAAATVIRSGASGKPVTFRTLTPTVCSVTTDGSSVRGLGGGCCTIAAEQAGDQNYEAAPQARMTFTVDPRLAQRIDLSTPPSLAVEGLASLAATSTSGRPVTLSLFTTPHCSLSGSFLRGIVAGSCPVMASLPGDATFAPAYCVAREIPVVAGQGTRGLAVYTSGGGAGTVTSSPAGIQCGAACSGNFATGSTVTLTAAAAAGSTVVGWTGPCSASGNTCTVGMDAVKAVTAHFGSDTPRLGNLSTRGWIAGGNDALIGGFVIGGSASKTVVIRARGPSLAAFGIGNAVLDPSLRLVRSSDQAGLGQNESASQATTIPNDGNITVLSAEAIENMGFGVTNASEAALLATLPPGAYTAIVTPGGGSAPGIGIFEVFEVTGSGQPLVNVSTRGRVGTGNDALIAGFVVQGNGPQRVIVRGRGPSLAAFGVTNALGNPTLQLVRSSDQAAIASNDDWGNGGSATAISASGFAPSDARESAILVTLQPGAYTAILTGVGGTTGTGIVEVFTY